MGGRPGSAAGKKLQFEHLAGAAEHAGIRVSKEFRTPDGARLQAVVAPGNRVIITDPRAGTAGDTLTLEGIDPDSLTESDLVALSKTTGGFSGLLKQVKDAFLGGGGTTITVNITVTGDKNTVT